MKKNMLIAVAFLPLLVSCNSVIEDPSNTSDFAISLSDIHSDESKSIFSNDKSNDNRSNNYVQPSVGPLITEIKGLSWGTYDLSKTQTLTVFYARQTAKTYYLAIFDGNSVCRNGTPLCSDYFSEIDVELTYGDAKHEMDKPRFLKEFQTTFDFNILRNMESSSFTLSVVDEKGLERVPDGTICQSWSFRFKEDNKIAIF